MNLEIDFLRFVSGRCHEGKEEEKEEEERIIVHHSSWNCSFALDRSICCPRFSFGGPLLAPTQLASATDAASTCFWACRPSGGVVMKRILLFSSLIVPSLLFTVERSMIYLAFVAASVVLCVLVAAARRRTTRETYDQRLTMSGENTAETKEQKNLVHQPLMHL
jgi:hypothetical protein